MKIEKKVKEKYFKEIVDGKKRFEVRLADFDCEPGDTIVLKEQVGEDDVLSGEEIECEVLQKFNTKDVEKFYAREEIDKYGLVILSVRKKFRYS